MFLVFFFLFVVFFVLGILSPSCSHELTQLATITNQNDSNEVSTRSFTLTSPPATAHVNVGTPAPTVLKTSSSRYIDPSLNFLMPELLVTQMPLTVLSNQTAEVGFLYYNTEVEVGLINDRDVWAYLNLDDLNNNGMRNSDIAIERTQGSGGSFYSLSAVNGAVYHLAGGSQVTRSSCLEYFPVTGMSGVEYYYQGWRFIDGDFFCVITNEGRMAVIQYKENSNHYTEDYTEYFSIVVTVYDQTLN
jgi:hypothetical protein